MKDWRVLATNFDKNEKEIVNSIEHKRFPLYGVQFHPEKSRYESVVTKDGVEGEKEAMDNFANFIVNEARKNQNTFDSKK